MSITRLEERPSLNSLFQTIYPVKEVMLDFVHKKSRVRTSKTNLQKLIKGSDSKPPLTCTPQPCTPQPWTPQPCTPQPEHHSPTHHSYTLQTKHHSPAFYKLNGVQTVVNLNFTACTQQPCTPQPLPTNTHHHYYTMDRPSLGPQDFLQWPQHTCQQLRA